MTTDSTDLLNTITELSHEFGSSRFVRGGGGNTSAKDASTVWVKPSGTTLAGLTPESFVALDRARLARLYDLAPPEDPTAREAMVKDLMAAARCPGSTGRPSVEAPLHESLAARFVVHTHPAWVNGMTCGRTGRQACRQLFPDALWLDYIDPGYTLCMQVRREIQRYRDERGREPALLFLKNHGLFVAADTAEQIRDLMAVVMDRLQAHYRQAEVSTELPVAPATATAAHLDTLREALGPETAVAVSGRFAVSTGPLTPDHLVYAKARFFEGRPTADAVAAFERQTGYRPHVICWDNHVFGVGARQKQADLALELAQDGALVQQLTAAFGGVDFMTDRARRFIENWEVESYRSRQL